MTSPHEPLVVDYLRTHSLAQLGLELGIKTSAKPGEYMWSLNYDQIESKAGPLVNECRGLILGKRGAALQTDQVIGTDPVGETYVMARPFNRFFNLGDFNAAPADMDDPDTIFFEKLDGTCCILYFNPELEAWHVATRSVPMADVNISGWGDMTFRLLFEKALRETLAVTEMVSDLVVFNNWTSQLDKEFTYCLELTTPMNRIVVQYPDYRVHLTGMRHTNSGKEFSIIPFAASTFFGVPVCPFHKINNLQELLTFVGSKSPFEQEGVVVCDKHFNRVKCKSLAYLAYNKVRDSSANSPRAVMELILSEKLDDVMPVLEVHIQEKAVKMQDGLRNLIHSVDAMYEEILPLSKGTDNDRKAFALQVQARNGWIGPLMDRWAGKCSGLADFMQKKKIAATGEWPSGLLDTLVTMSLKE